MVLLSSPRATLGPKKSLINSITQISKPPVQWQNNTATLQWHTQSTQQGNRLTPEWSERRVSLRAPSPDVAVPTDADAGRTDVSVDPVRRTARTPVGRPLSVTATATATSPDCAPADSPAAPTTTASACLLYTSPSPRD